MKNSYFYNPNFNMLTQPTYQTPNLPSISTLVSDLKSELGAFDKLISDDTEYTLVLWFLMLDDPKTCRSHFQSERLLFSHQANLSVRELSARVHRLPTIMANQKKSNGILVGM